MPFRDSPPRAFPLVRAAATLVLLLTASLPSPAGAKPKSVSPALGRVQPGAAMSERFLSRDRNGQVMADLLIQGTVPLGLLRARGIEVGTAAGGWITARCPVGLLGALEEMDGIDRIQVSSRCEPSLDVSVVDAGVSTVRTVGPSDITGQTGQGVIVGIVDSGIDLDHADLLNANGSTRVVSIWDQTVLSGTPPIGFTYGAEYDSVAINRNLAPESDAEGHGTHVITTAAGNGRATGNGLPAGTFVGVAPKADVVAVKTSFSTTGIVDGVHYIFNQAAALGKKAVVNLSLSTQEGPHDGTFPFDLMVNALTGPGRIVCASAGNRQLDDLHAQVDLNGTTPGSLVMNVPTYAKNSGPENDYLLVSGWYPGEDQISITIQSPNGFTIGPVVPGATTAQSTTDGAVTIHNATTNPTNGDGEIYVEIFDQTASRTPETGNWTFTFTPIALTSTGIVDTYIFANALGNGSNLARWTTGIVPYGAIGSPGCADSVITVAAHSTKVCWTSINTNTYCWSPTPPLDDIAPFSSRGPLRDGKLKPDLSGPGNGVAAGRSTAATFQPELIMPDGVHVMLSGTSMSSPHVTGVVALLLAQPAWANASPTAVKTRLEQTARADAFTGAVPNGTWGYGKLNAAAALAPLTSLQVARPPKGYYMPPGKPDSVTVVLGGMTADSVVVELSRDGGSSYTVPLGTLYGVAPGPPRSLSFNVDYAWSTTRGKVRATARNATTTQAGTSDSLFAVQAPVGVDDGAAAATPRLALDSNRPNPFNPETTIGFQLDRPGRARLRVYSIRGELVRTLVNSSLPAGRFTARWDGRDQKGRPAASGIYFSELLAEGQRLTRKMSLLK